MPPCEGTKSKSCTFALRSCPQKGLQWRHHMQSGALTSVSVDGWGSPCNLELPPLALGKFRHARSDLHAADKPAAKPLGTFLLPERPMYSNSGTSNIWKNNHALNRTPSCLPQTRASSCCSLSCCFFSGLVDRPSRTGPVDGPYV